MDKSPDGWRPQHGIKGDESDKALFPNLLFVKRASGAQSSSWQISVSSDLASWAGPWPGIFSKPGIRCFFIRAAVCRKNCANKGERSALCPGKWLETPKSSL